MENIKDNSKEEFITHILKAFEDPHKWHIEYKSKIKRIILIAFTELGEYSKENPELFQEHNSVKTILDWIDNFVEKKCKEFKLNG